MQKMIESLKYFYDEKISVTAGRGHTLEKDIPKYEIHRKYFSYNMTSTGSHKYQGKCFTYYGLTSTFSNTTGKIYGGMYKGIDMILLAEWLTRSGLRIILESVNCIDLLSS